MAPGIMAKLKEHMLLEVATTFCKRHFHHYKDHCSTLEEFVLSGKEPARVFRRIVAFDITIQYVTPDYVLVTYRGEGCSFQRTFLNILMIMWARRAHLVDFDWLYASPKLGFLKVMAQNTGFEELRIKHFETIDYLRQIPIAFPKLVILKLTAENFASLLSVAHTELACLKEVVLFTSYMLFEAHKALSEHQNKLPSLDTIHYDFTPLEEILFPDNANNVLSVKHLIISAKTDCCTPFDYSFLSAAQKMFPSLESVEINASVGCFSILVRHCKAPKLEVVKSFYEAFESLSLGFSIKMVYVDRFKCLKKDFAELRQFFATKGKVYETPDRWTVKTAFPRKKMIYEVIPL